MYELESQQKQSVTDPIGVLPLKQISQICAVQQQQANKEIYQLDITVTNWLKRSTEQAIRTFTFLCDSEDDLEEWTIFLEFAKAKAIYNDFVENFGKISFPINLTVDAYDNALTMELTQHLRKIRIAKNSDTSQIQGKTFRYSRQSKLKLHKATHQGSVLIQSPASKQH
jgi:adenylate cyclase 10